MKINKDDEFSFDDSAIALPTIFNSPPDSVKSISSNEDADYSINFLINDSNDMIETEKSFDFVNEALIQPMKNSQDFLYPGPLGFHEEIETVSCEQSYNMICGHNDDLVKNEDEMMFDIETPIVGNDLMFSERQIPQFGFRDEIKTEVLDENMNKMPMQATVKLLARRALNRPQIQLKIKMGPVLENGNSNKIIEDSVTVNNAVISTPQLINELWEKECETEKNFDLVRYIDGDNVS